MFDNLCFAILNDHALIKVQGPDAKKFLQGQLSCDMEAITPEQSRLAVHCNPKGRIISSFRVWLYEDNYYLSVPRCTLSSSMDALKKYAVFSQVELSQDTHHTQIMLSCPETQLQSLHDLGPLPQTIDQCHGTDLQLIIKIPGITPCYLLISEKHTLDINAEEISDQNMALQLIQSGIPTITQAIQEKFTPHALNLQLINAISFTKGCYTGQEIIARMQYLGKLKEQLYHIECITDQQPSIGEALITPENKAVGTIINICKTGDRSYEALAVIKKKDADHAFLDRQPPTKINLFEHAAPPS